jgi:hypothetical protein
VATERTPFVTIGSPGREHPATDALRHGSIEELTALLADDLRRHADGRDERDVMLHLTPYWDAVRRLGGEPGVVFEAAAAGLPDKIADLARRFGRRTGLTLAAMGWRLDETTDGPAYRFAWPRWTPPKVGSARPRGAGSSGDGRSPDAGPAAPRARPGSEEPADPSGVADREEP